ncbi:GMC family oxidoreductase N-terminal domain-containing protein, partial [Mycobacterium tuberculosis]
MGLRCNADFNGESQEGIGVFRTNTHRGRRWSAADGYLRPALLRRNLEVHGGTRVSRVLFEGGRAVGVEYASKGQVVRVRA